jgi:CBS domain-containing protein
MPRKRKTESSLNEALEDLKAARDEARLQLHLLSMEARQRWHELEAKLEALDAEAVDRGEKAARNVVSKARELAGSVRAFIEQNVTASGLSTPVRSVMTEDARSCAASDPLNRAAQIMWERDCGAVPVVDDEGTVVGMLTDRDVCMAAYFQGRSLWACTIGSAMSKTLYACSPEDSIERAVSIMAERQVRRLPVVGADGHLLGMVALGDIALYVKSLSGLNPEPHKMVADALGAISGSGVAAATPLKRAAE